MVQKLDLEVQFFDPLSTRYLFILEHQKLNISLFLGLSVKGIRVQKIPLEMGLNPLDGK